jgi:REP element-mobilizing transposase RayT
MGPRRGSLAAIIGAFKSETTKRVNRLNDTHGRPLWQPNYYERVIRGHNGEWGRIARYIGENPQNWG